jgi:hypothetical protein
MHWLIEEIEETDDCGVNWRRAELTDCYWHPRIAMLEALAIIEDEWRPPQSALRELTTALTEDSTAIFWEKGIRIVRVGQRPCAGVGGVLPR